MSFKNIIIIILCFGLSISCVEKTPFTQIKQLISKSFDRPDSKVQTHSVVVVDNYAIVDWSQDKKAGRALLELQNEKWQLRLCGGKGLKQVASLVQSSVPAATAGKLIKQLTEDEASLDTRLLQSFDSFGPSMKFSDTNSNHSNK